MHAQLQQLLLLLCPQHDSQTQNQEPYLTAAER
jgi:hypothetical protein